MENVYEITLLLDFYGQLLTPRQHEILDLHYNNDYSLGEIAEQLNISRQGVYDSIKKGKTFLNELEQKLGLVGRFSEQKITAREILELIKNINPDSLSSEDKARLKRAEEGIQEMVKKL